MEVPSSSFHRSSWDSRTCYPRRAFNQTLTDDSPGDNNMFLNKRPAVPVKWKDECYQDQALDVYCQKKRSKRLVLTLVFFSLRNRTLLSFSWSTMVSLKKRWPRKGMKESSVKSLRKKKTKNTLKEINSLCSLLFLDNDFTVSFSTISCLGPQ